MKRFVIAIALTGVLSVTALAGEIPSGGFNAPPPDETPPIANTPMPGEVPSGGLTQEISEAALTLIQSLLGVVV